MHSFQGSSAALSDTSSEHGAMKESTEGGTASDIWERKENMQKDLKGPLYTAVNEVIGRFRRHFVEDR